MLKTLIHPSVKLHFLTNGKYSRESHLVSAEIFFSVGAHQLRLDIWLAQKYFGFNVSNFPLNSGSFIYDNTNWCFLEYDTLAGNSCVKERCSMGKLTYGKGPGLERNRFLLSQICSHQPAPLPLACPWMHLQNFELRLFFLTRMHLPGFAEESVITHTHSPLNLNKDCKRRNSFRCAKI